MSRNPLDARHAMLPKSARRSARKSRSPEGPVGAKATVGSVPRSRSGSSRLKARPRVPASGSAIDLYLLDLLALPELDINESGKWREGVTVLPSFKTDPKRTYVARSGSARNLSVARTARSEERRVGKECRC